MSKLFYDNGHGKMVRGSRRVPWHFVNALVEIWCWVVGCNVEERQRTKTYTTVSCKRCHRTSDIPASVRFELR